MGKNIDTANPTDKTDNSKKEQTEINLYFGIFFDGTNNNKYQTMLGKMFRRKEIFEKAIKRQNSGSDVLFCTNGGIEYASSIEKLLEHSRAEVEEIYRGAFTRSELEFLYFGYRNINDTSDNSYSTTIETKNAIELGNINPNRLSALPDDDIERAKLYLKAKDFAIRKDSNTETIESFKGAAAQEVTYTNVAILEGLYKCENETQNNIVTKRHISIYVEGSGSDMQFEASTKTGYILTIGVAGLGLGTGPTGVVAKVRKAATMVQQTLNKYQYDNDVKDINLHFDLFGFSRGATCARVMAYLINPDPNNSKAYCAKDAITTKPDDLELLTTKSKEFLPIDGKTNTKEIRFMGLFDTVSSIGVINKDIIISTLCEYINDTIEAEEGPNKKDIPTLWNAVKSKILPACKTVANLIGKKGGKTVGTVITQSIPVVGPVLSDVGGEIGEIVGEKIGNYFGEKVGNYVTDKVGSKVDPIIDEIKKYVQEGKYQYRDKGTEDLTAIIEGKSPYHRDNVKDYGLWATKLAKNVVHVCAMDEVRRNFALVDIESSLIEGTNKSIEVFIPGCHTDIGGGASIGMEEAKLIKKKSNRLLTSYYVHNKSWLEKDEGEVLVKPITVDALKEMGWLNQDSTAMGSCDKTTSQCPSLDEDETQYDNKKSSNIIMYRHVNPGYSNIALNFIKEESEDDPFSAIPRAYKVPKDLNDLYARLKTIEGNGRYFVYPNNLGQYSELRRKFIHFSSNEQFPSKKAVADNRFVNSPEYTEIKNAAKGKIKVISRIIYPGVSDAKPMHMFDYEEGHPGQIQEEDNPPQSGLHPLLSGDYSGFEEYDTSLDRLVFNPA